MRIRCARQGKYTAQLLAEFVPISSTSLLIATPTSMDAILLGCTFQLIEYPLSTRPGQIISSFAVEFKRAKSLCKCAMSVPGATDLYSDLPER